MSPLLLIQAGSLYDRAGVTCNSHFVLIPARLRSLWRNPFVGRRTTFICRQPNWMTCHD